MKVAILLVAFVARINGETKEMDQDTYMSSYLADLWLDGADILRILWRDCSKKVVDVKDAVDAKEYFPKFMKCMKKKSLRALDRSLSTDVVPLMDRVNLVRYELVDRSGNVVHNSENHTSLSDWTDKELDENDWRVLALRRMAAVLHTHVIKLDLNGDTILPEKAEFRHRRRRQMMTMMMFGIVSIGMVVVPMGFQFLAVLGGKALLLAKMALILASIQGLRKVDAWERYEKGKIAPSPVNYGFYQAYPYDHYEKRSQNDWPEPAMFPGTAPPPLPRHSQWPIDLNIKYDRSLSKRSELRNALIDKLDEEIKARNKNVWMPEITKAIKESAEPRLYPVYTESAPPSSILTSIDAPKIPPDLTTSPGEVQMDFALDFPYNRMIFQNSTTIV